MHRRNQIIASMAALSAMSMDHAQTSTVEPVKYKPHVNPFPHQSNRQRARYARQITKGQIRNAVCAWWCYPGAGQ